MIIVVDRSDLQPIPVDQEIQAAVDEILKNKEVPIPDGILEIKLCSDEEMQAMNAEFLDKNLITDVLAFELLEMDPETKELLVGSIAVNHDLAVRNASEHVATAKLPYDEFEKYLRSEVLLYVLHGVLHFAGYDDDFPEERKAMFDMAAECLQKLGHSVIPYE
jgi:probable rRNA maturation factor